MTIGEVIDRIRSQCPDFAEVNHVLTSPATMTYPAALVSPVRNVASKPVTFGTSNYQQDVNSVIGVYIVMERRQNGAFDSGTSDLFDILTTSLRAALVNWKPSGLIQQIFYAGGEMAPYDQGLVTWREDFSAKFTMETPS